MQRLRGEKSNFTVLNFDVFKQLKSKYAQFFYEKMCRFRDTQKIILGLEKFKQQQGFSYTKNLI